MSEVFNEDVLDAINRALSAENVVTREGEEPVYCNVNNETREIEIPGEITIFGVEHDENAVRVFFKCPKIIGDNVYIDITQSMVYIIYINAGGEKDQYIVTDVNETEDGDVTFSWLINRKPAKYQGITQFGIRVIKSKTGGEIENEWNTTVANANILNGVETEDIELSGDNIDVVNQLLDLTKQEIELTKQNSIEEIEQKGQETLETIPSDYTTLQNDISSLSKEKVGVGLTVNDSNYSELNIHSIYDLPVNSVNKVARLTSDMVSGLPEYGGLGALIRINPVMSEGKENEFSCYLYYGYNGTLYYTFGTSSSSINKWNEILEKMDDTILSAKIDDFVSPDILVSNNIHSIYDMPINSISALSGKITEEQLRYLPVYGKLSTFIRFNPYSLDTRKGEFSIYFYFSADEMWFTFGTSNTSISDWKKIALYTDVSALNENFETLKNEIDELKCKLGNGFSAFSRFAVVGDSLSVGYYTDSDDVQHSTDYYHSWPAYAGRLSDSTPYWCGASGQTCKSWLSHNSGDWGLEYTKSLGTMPLYIISMGANESEIAIGTPSDIGTDSDTLYAYVSKTINELRKISPKSYIVCTGISRGQGLNNRINDVYEDVCSYYDKCYYMDVESELNSEEFKKYYFNYHYSASGYFKMAMLYNYKLGKIMDENISDFLYINESEENVTQPK